MTLNTTIDIGNRWIHTNALDLSTTQDSDSWTYVLSMTDGTGDNNSDNQWHDLREVTVASGIDDIDLAGVLENAFGQALTFTFIKKIIIENMGVGSGPGVPTTGTPTDGEDLLIGGAGTAASSGFAVTTLFNGDANAQLTLRSGGVFIVTAPMDGYAVTAGTADILRVEHSGTDDIVYRIIIEGVATVS